MQTRKERLELEVWEVMRSIVKAKMESDGIKQKFIAKKCGYGAKAFSMLINGHTVITDEDIEKFCFGACVCPNELFVRIKD